MQRTQFSISHIATVTLVVAVLLAVPRLRLEMLEVYVVGTIILHQVCCASLAGMVVWYALGRHRVVALVLTGTIGAVWGPYSIDIVERTIWGDPTTIYRTTEALGLTEVYGAVWFQMCHAFDYQMKIAIQ